MAVVDGSVRTLKMPASKAGIQERGRQADDANKKIFMASSINSLEPRLKMRPKESLTLAKRRVPKEICGNGTCTWRPRKIENASIF